MADSVILDYGAAQFSTSPSLRGYDMVILDLDENNYVSSPYAKIVDDSKMTSRANGTYSFTWNASSTAWRYGTTSNYYTAEQILSTYGIEIYYASLTGFADAPKAGDTITVVLIKDGDPNANEKMKISLTCDMTRSGSVMEAACPLVKPAERQSVADSLLKDLYGLEYQPYTASRAMLDPSAEVGDSIMAYGHYSGIYSQEINFDSMMSSEISAPIEEEVDNEMEYQSSSERNYKRKFADIAAEFLIKADEISARVTKEGTGNGFSWSLQYDRWVVNHGNTEVLKVDADGLHVTGDGTFSGTIYASDGEFTGAISASTIDGSTITGGSINIGDGAFTVSNNGSFNATSGSISGNVNVEGNVYASNIRSTAVNGYGGSFSGLGLTPSTISGVKGGSLVDAVIDRLGWANDYNNATGQNTTNFPSYFRAGHFTTPNSYYGPSFIVANSQGYSEVHLESHYHTFTESNGTIKIGQPTTTQGSFSIAATQTYKDMVAALTISSSNSTFSINESSDGKFYNINVTAKNAAGTVLKTWSDSTGTNVWSNGYYAGEQAHANDWQNGYNQGESAGYSTGYNYGYGVGYDNGYDTGWWDGYNYAYGN